MVLQGGLTKKEVFQPAAYESSSYFIPLLIPGIFYPLKKFF